MYAANTNATVVMTQTPGLEYSPQPTLNSTGTLESVSETLYDRKTYSDAFGKTYRTESITGGTVHSYTLTQFDSRNRPIAEMQQTAGDVVTAWSDTANSFVVPPSGGTPETVIPATLTAYDAEGRLAGIQFPFVADPNDNNVLKRAQYQYDERGNQTAIIDPLGQTTTFKFTSRDQQESRTLPLGFTDSFTDDDQDRQLTHTSFEDVVTENVYDAVGRVSAKGLHQQQRLRFRHRQRNAEEVYAIQARAANAFQEHRAILKGNHTSKADWVKYLTGQ